MKTLEEVKLANSWDSYKSYLERKDTGIHTGLKELDDYLRGLGSTISIQGETSVNKSTLALQIAHFNARCGNPVIIIDKENGRGLLMSRLLCQSEEKSEWMIRHYTPEEKWAAVNKLNSIPMYIYTEATPDQVVIAERVKEAYSAHNKPVLLLVDSVQALEAAASDPRVSLETWVYFFDRLKVELDGKLTVMMVSEKNRVSYGGSSLGSGKGSNVLDYKPETVLDIRWNDVDDTYVVKVLKHRQGLRGGEFEMKKQLADTSDNRSFCFLLREASDDFAI